MKKKILIGLFLCLFFFVCLVFVFTLSRGDTFVNYGFSYAITKGEILYRDFNLILPPLSPFFYSIGLFLWNNILMIYLEQALLLTGFAFLIYKLLGKKSFLFFFFLLIPYPIAMASTIYPGYNFLLVFFFFLFLYCLKEEKNPLYLGLLLGTMITTKHTVGLLFFLPTIAFLWKDRKKFWKIVLGMLIPIGTCFLYLLITRSLGDFIQLGILGLFDFQKGNHSIDLFYFTLFLFGLLYFLLKVIHHPKDLKYYYAICFSSIVFPIIDYYHVSLFLVIVVFFSLEEIKVKDKLAKYFVLLTILLCIGWGGMTYLCFPSLEIQNAPHFTWVVNPKTGVEHSKDLVKYVDSLDKEVIYFMRGSENYYYKMVHDEKLTYFDLPNEGNYGYHGTKKMKEKILQKHDVYFVLDQELLKSTSKSQQYLKELGETVKKKSILVEEIGFYQIYYKE